MNQAHLQELALFIKDQPAEDIKMHKTSRCVSGMCCRMLAEKRRHDPTHPFNMDIAADYLGLTDEQRFKMFLSRDITVAALDRLKITKDEVLDMIEHAIEHGEVRWPPRVEEVLA